MTFEEKFKIIFNKNPGATKSLFDKLKKAGISSPTINSLKKETSSGYSNLPSSSYTRQPSISIQGEIPEAPIEIPQRQSITDRVNSFVNYIQPQPNKVRVIDVVREIPEAGFNIVSQPVKKLFDFIDKGGAQILNVFSSPIEAISSKIGGDPELKTSKDVWDRVIQNWGDRAIEIGHPLEEIFKPNEPGKGMGVYTEKLQEVGKPLAETVMDKNSSIVDKATKLGGLIGLGTIDFLANPFYLISIKGIYKGSFELDKPTKALVLQGMFNPQEQEAFKALGLRQGATEQEINQAFKKIAQQSHPDKLKSILGRNPTIEEEALAKGIYQGANNARSYLLGKLKEFRTPITETKTNVNPTESTIKPTQAILPTRQISQFQEAPITPLLSKGISNVAIIPGATNVAFQMLNESQIKAAKTLQTKLQTQLKKKQELLLSNKATAPEIKKIQSIIQNIEIGLKEAERNKISGTGPEIQRTIPTERVIPETSKSISTTRETGKNIPFTIEQRVTLKENEAIIPIKKIDNDLIPLIKEKINVNAPRIKALEKKYLNNEDVPIIPVYKQGDKYITNSDGFHRLQAQRNLGIKEVKVKIEPKTNLTGSQKQKLEHEINQARIAIKPTKIQAKKGINIGQEKKILPTKEEQFNKVLEELQKERVRKIERKPVESTPWKKRKIAKSEYEALESARKIKEDNKKQKSYIERVKARAEELKKLEDIRMEKAKQTILELRKKREEEGISTTQLLREEKLMKGLQEFEDQTGRIVYSKKIERLSKIETEIQDLNKQLEIAKKEGKDEAYFRDLDVKLFSEFLEGKSAIDKSAIVSKFIDDNFGVGKAEKYPEELIKGKFEMLPELKITASANKKGAGYWFWKREKLSGYDGQISIGSEKNVESLVHELAHHSYLNLSDKLNNEFTNILNRLFTKKELADFYKKWFWKNARLRSDIYEGILNSNSKDWRKTLEVGNVYHDIANEIFALSFENYHNLSNNRLSTYFSVKEYNREFFNFVEKNKIIDKFINEINKAEIESKTKKVELQKIVDNSIQYLSKFKSSNFQGYPDLTIKFFEYAKGKVNLSKQEILDFAKRPELRKSEADLLSKLGNEIGEAKIIAQDFADSIYKNLLKLKPVKAGRRYINITIDIKTNKVNGESLNKNYEEVIFESPITTNGSSHYPDSKNYFAHTRGDEIIENGKKIWREQEIQSDLLQKTTLEELKSSIKKENYRGILRPEVEVDGAIKVGAYIEDLGDRSGEITDIFSDGSFKWAEYDIINKYKNKKIPENLKIVQQGLKQEKIDQLFPYINDRFGERIMRERIKAKAQENYSKYRLPTGETIGKIEGVEADTWYDLSEIPGGKIENRTQKDILGLDNLKVGKEVSNGERWIITDILGDGRFKAVPKQFWEEATPELRKMTYGELSEKAINQTTKEMIERTKETFDLTGKSNPQAKRYENWGKFLKNKFDGKEVIDQQGNKWVEVDLKSEYKTAPVEMLQSRIFFLPSEIANGVDATWQKIIGDKAYKGFEFFMNKLSEIKITLPAEKEPGVSIHYPFEYMFGTKQENLRPYNRQLQRGIAQAKATVLDIAKDLSKLSEEEQSIVLKKIEDMDYTNDKLGQVAKDLESEFVKVGYDLVKRGLMKEETFREYMGRYFPRMYEAFTESNQIAYQILKKRLSNQAYMKLKKDAYGVIYRDGRSRIVKKFETKEERDLFIKNELKPKNKKYDTFAPIKETKIEELKRIEKLPYVVVTRLLQEMNDVVIWDYLDAISQDKNLVSNIQDIKNGFINLIPKTPAYGSLGGKYIHEWYYSNVKDLVELSAQSDRALRFFNGVVKGFKTILDPAVGFANAVSNLFLADMAGVPIERIDYWVKNLYHSLTNKGAYKILEQEGATKQTYAIQEIENFMKIDANKEELKELLFNDSKLSTFDLMGTLYKLVKKGWIKAGDLYSFSEDWAKSTCFDWATNELGMKREEAIQFANDAIFNYSEVSRGLKTLRRSFAGAAFPTFAAKIIAGGIKAQIRKPFTIAKWHFILGSIAAASLTYYGITKEDIKRLKPESVGSWFIVTDVKKDNRGNIEDIQLTDLSRYLPWGQITSMPIGIDSASDLIFHPEFLTEKREGGYSLIKGQNIFSAFIPAQLIWKPLFELYSNHSNFTDKEIFPEDVTPVEKMFAWIDYLTISWLPSWTPSAVPEGKGGYMYQKLHSAFTQIPDFQGRITSINEALLRVIGTKISHIRPQDEFSFMYSDIRKDINNAKSKIGSETSRYQAALQNREGTTISKNQAQLRYDEQIKLWREKLQALTEEYRALKDAEIQFKKNTKTQ